MKSFLFVAAASALAFALRAHAADLTVEITNPRSADGFVGAAPSVRRRSRPRPSS